VELAPHWTSLYHQYQSISIKDPVETSGSLGHSLRLRRSNRP